MAIPAGYRRVVMKAALTVLQLPTGFYWDWLTPQDFEGRRLMVRWGRVSGGVSMDPAITTHDFVNITSDAIDSTWTEQDLINIENRYDTFWTAIKGSYAPEYSLDEYRWYKLGPDIVPPNPPVRVTDRSVVGTNAGDSLPPQVAVSVTERTGTRRRWGRFYLPPPSVQQVDGAGSGRISNGFITQVANAAEAMYEGWKSDDFLPVVWSPSTQAAFSVESVQVDDLFDVIRSRRWKNPTVRDNRPI